MGGATYTSYVNGKTLPGAWNVELDIPVIDAATSQGYSLLRVWGITNQEISQANDLIGKNIAVYGGMQKGLPLANPAQSGLLVSGIVYQAFGNNEGTDRTLDFVISPGTASGTNNTGGIGTLKNPKNLTLNWAAGQPLATALQNCRQTAFPGYTVNISINAGIVRPNDELAIFSTLEQIAQFCKQTSADIIKTSGYAGVSIILTGTTISVFDGSAPASGNPTAINFQDLIGQPTWIESPNISLKTVMRADLSVGKMITLPQTLILNTQQANSSLLNQKATFQGGFNIISLRHVGDFRSPSAQGWVTVIEAAPNQLVGANG